MLCFTLTGKVGRVRPGAPGETVIAVTSKRLLQTGETTSEWVVCVCRGNHLRALVQRRIAVGDVVRIEGEIEPRRRVVGGLAFYDVVFVARSFEVLTREPVETGS